MTLLKNGLYALRLAATDAGGRELVDESVVRVTGEMKVGTFTVSFTDGGALLADGLVAEEN